MGFRSFGQKVQRLQPHERLTVLVGPNEAGKSSLLDALRSLDSPVAQDDIHGELEPEDCEFEFLFELADDEKELVEREAGHRADSLALTKNVGSEDETWDIRPRPPSRDLAALEKTIEKVMSNGGVYTEGIETACVQLRDACEKSPTHSIDEPLLRQTLETYQDRLPDAKEDLAKLIQIAFAETPFEKVVRSLQASLPRILSFDDAHRGLVDRYPIVAPTPQPNSPSRPQNRQPLDNLMSLAGLDLDDLSKHRGKVQIASQEANDRLREAFGEIWGPDKPYPQIGLDPSWVQVYVRDPSNDVQNGLSIERRSAGVRWLVELVCLIGPSSNRGRQTILLTVDEIEQHLHYDAQVDVLEWLQQGVPRVQVICTTHSIGCWPRNLGSQMNAISKARGQSAIAAGPYSPSEAGYSGLLRALGATRANLALNRKIVFCEGEIDELLFPGLFREVVGDEVEPCFVGSLAQTSGRSAPTHKVNAPEVYLLDKDSAGDAMRKELLRGDQTRVNQIFDVGLGADRRTIEDLVHIDVYRAGIEIWKREKGIDDDLTISADKPVVEQLESALIATRSRDKTKSLLSSLKTRVAQHVLMLSRDDQQIVRSDLEQPLSELWSEIEACLERDEPGGVGRRRGS